MANVLAFMDTAAEAAQMFSVPLEIVTAVIDKESGGNPNALGSAGDAGLMQLTPRIYKAYNVNPWNPQENIIGGVSFLSDLYKQYGNWRDALSHYNAGYNLKAGRGYADDVLNRAGSMVGIDQASSAGVDTGSSSEIGSIGWLADKVGLTDWFKESAATIIFIVLGLILIVFALWRLITK